MRKNWQKFKDLHVIFKSVGFYSLLKFEAIDRTITVPKTIVRARKSFSDFSRGKNTK